MGIASPFQEHLAHGHRGYLFLQDSAIRSKEPELRIIRLILAEQFAARIVCRLHPAPAAQPLPSTEPSHFRLRQPTGIALLALPA